jgi:L-seryl-tRNA(Ser) seleniumtransferase
MIALSAEELARRAADFQRAAAPHGLALETCSGESTIGGGSLPGETLPTTLLVLPRALTAARLRAAAIPVIARTQSGRTLLDLRTVAPEEEEDLLATLREAAGRA